MTWWEGIEAYAHRTRTPADMAHRLWQRFGEAGIDPDLALLPAHQIATLVTLCCDFVKHTESVLVAADGDAAAIRRALAAIDLWLQQARFWTELSAKPFAQLLNSLALDTERLDESEFADDEGAARLPQEQAKADGRYRMWHLLYERLDIKLASTGADPQIARALARDLAEVYEEIMVALRAITRLEKESRPRFRTAARLLLDLNTAFHFHLGPHHFGQGEIRPTGAAAPSLRNWILFYLVPK